MLTLSDLPKDKFHLLIVPNSDHEKDYIYQCNGDFDKAFLMSEQEPGSASYFQFDSKEKMEEFIRGYHAGIGYLGEGISFSKDAETESKTEYFLFGSNVSEAHESEDMDAVKYLISTGHDWSIAEFDPSKKTAAELIQEADGWMGHAQITKDEYEDLQSTFQVAS